MRKRKSDTRGGRKEKRRLARRGWKRKGDSLAGIGGETPQRQWGSFDSRANWNAADANDDGTPWVGLPPLHGGGGFQGVLGSAGVTPGIGGAYISRRGGVARDIEAYHLRRSFLSLFVAFSRGEYLPAS